MPTGPGSPAPPPGGSAICEVSPSDLAGQVDNLVSRVEALEDLVGLLTGANVNAGELSELSQQVGWVGGVTYMGVEGWIQTEYGTLIPPPGFSLLGNGVTLSDGNTYQAVVMDENGVLQFGFGQTDPDGVFTAVAGTMASSINYAVLYSNNPIRDFTTSSGQTVATMNIGHNPAGIVSLLTTERFQVSQSGYYLLTITCSLHCYNDATGDGETWLRWSIQGNTSTSFDPYYNNGPNLFLDANGNASHSEQLSASKLMFLDSDAYSELLGITQDGGATPTMKVGQAMVTLQLLQAKDSP